MARSQPARRAGNFFMKRLAHLDRAEINAELYKSGKISYYEWAKRDVELWRWKKLDKAEPYLKKIKLVEGSGWLFQNCRQQD
jgi:hypothetical protein